MIDTTLLHALWTKAVGTPDYEKSQWLKLEAQIVSANRTLNERSAPDTEKNLRRFKGEQKPTEWEYRRPAQPWE